MWLLKVHGTLQRRRHRAELNHSGENQVSNPRPNEHCVGEDCPGLTLATWEKQAPKGERLPWGKAKAQPQKGKDRGREGTEALGLGTRFSMVIRSSSIGSSAAGF